MKFLVSLFTFSFVVGCNPAEERAPSDKTTGLIGQTQESYDLACEWLRSNMREKGLFGYIYEVDKDHYPNKNNALRQLMASRLLAELSQEDPTWLPLHRRNLNFVFRRWYREEGDIGCIYYNRKSKLGANAMALRTLVYSPLFTDYAEQAKRLANGILALMHPDGSFDPWLIEPPYSYDADYLLTFYSGEAILSLIEYYEATESERYLNVAVLAQDFYLDRYVNHMEEYYYPAYVPWHTQSLAKLYKITGEARYADAVFILNNKLLELLDTKKHIGRFFNPGFPQYGKPHSASDGVYTEGLAYAYELALLRGDRVHQQRYRNALTLAVRNLRSLQYGQEETRSSPHPERIRGGIRYSVADSRVRIDTVQHAMDAYRKLFEVMRDAKQ